MSPPCTGEKRGYRIKATEWHRITLAVQAQAGDPTAFGRDREGKPIDLVPRGPIAGPAPLLPGGPGAQRLDFCP